MSDKQQEAQLMELATTLKCQTVQNAVREVGINPNHWYPVGWANQLQVGEIMPVTVWQQAIAIYRDQTGQIHALEDACPHKGVALHKGNVQGCHLACAYHGWEFNGQGECTSIPYLPAGQKLPRAPVRSYPIQEKYSLIWVFPGDPELAASQNPPDMPEFGQSDALLVTLTAQMQAHFSICNENAMDVFHGYLHQNLQGWFNPILRSLQETETSVRAEYDVSYKGRMAKFLGLSEKSEGVTTRRIAINYNYPHYATSLEGISSLYLMRLPIGPTASRSFAFFFLKLRLPQWLLKWLAPILQFVVRNFVFMRFLSQDIEMMESEQQTYLKNPQRRYVEINPAIIALERLIIRQYEQFVQKSSQLKNEKQSFASGATSSTIAPNSTEPTQENSLVG